MSASDLEGRVAVVTGAAQKSALKQLVKTFFDGSTSNAVAALLDMSGKDLSESELDRLAKIVEAAKNEDK